MKHIQKSICLVYFKGLLGCLGGKDGQVVDSWFQLWWWSQGRDLRVWRSNPVSGSQLTPPQISK